MIPPPPPPPPPQPHGYQQVQRSEQGQNQTTLVRQIEQKQQQQQQLQQQQKHQQQQRQQYGEEDYLQQTHDRAEKKLPIVPGEKSYSDTVAMGPGGYSDTEKKQRIDNIKQGLIEKARRYLIDLVEGFFRT